MGSGKASVERRPTWTIGTLCACAAAAAVVEAPLPAHGKGAVTIDSSGFLKKSSDRTTSFSWVGASADFDSRGSVLGSRIQIETLADISDFSTVSVESENLYVDTSPGLTGPNQFSLGRRRYTWSAADDAWRMGLWNPRFLWDPLHPRQVGLTGAFYSYRSRHWSLLAYGSPISVPERGFPVKEDGGTVTSASPFWVPLKEAAVIQGTPIPMRYSIAYPALMDIITRPAAGVRAGFETGGGVWISAAYGVMPIHQPMLEVESALDLGSLELDNVIHPRFPMHHLATVEAGFTEDSFSIWGSLSGESPIAADVTPDRVARPMGPALIAAWGAELRWDPGLSVRGSLLAVSENAPPPAEDTAVDVEELQSRFPFERALALGARWEGASPLTYDVQWTFDAAQTSNLVSLDLTYVSRARRLRGEAGWEIGLGADVLTTSTGLGWIGQQEGNDRVRGRITYAF